MVTASRLAVNMTERAGLKTKSKTSYSRVSSFLISLSVLVLTGCLARAIALNLAPVYGTLPVSHALERVEYSSLFFAILLLYLQGDSAYALDVRRLSLWATCILPTVPYLLRHSGLLYRIAGLTAGSVVHVVAGPFVFLLTVLAMRLSLDAAPAYTLHRLRNGGPLTGTDKWVKFLLFALAPAVYIAARNLISQLVIFLVTMFPNMYIQLANNGASRRALQVWSNIALSLILQVRSRLWGLRLLFFQVLIWSPFAYEALTRTRQQVANARLRPVGYDLVESKESVTGYVAVFESTKDGFRVLRNDHSLLGGQWLLSPERRRAGAEVNESIYSIFYMLEAVRLVEQDVVFHDSSRAATPEALVIGLGIGTAPSALAAHGIVTNAVEIDPVVTEFAIEYFGLNRHVRNINQDALKYVRDARSNNRTFDFIIHDVFTGGIEPEALFEPAFFRYLSTISAPNGVVAINYVGDLNAVSTSVILLRILSNFGSCKFFRDSPPSSEPGGDFANIVAFCTNNKSAWHFRAPTESDFLHTEGRRRALVPRYELDMEEHTRILLESGGSGPNPGREALKSAMEHWKIMRSVVPDVVWENW